MPHNFLWGIYFIQPVELIKPIQPVELLVVLFEGKLSNQIVVDLLEFVDLYFLELK